MVIIMAGLNTQFKTKYTKQECEECLQWYERHIDELPQSIDPIRALRIPNLQRTVRRLINVLKKRMPEERIFNGEFSILLIIREKLREQGLVKD